MALTQIDIDEEALAEAMRLSGAKTKKDTVNLALRDFAARHRRIAALEHYAALAAGWDFEEWERRRAAEKTRRRDPLPARLLRAVADLARFRAAGVLGRGRLRWRGRILPSPACRIPALRPDPRRVRADVGDVRCSVPRRSGPQGRLAMD